MSTGWNPTKALCLLVALALAAVGFIVVAPTASAAVGFTVTPIFPTNVTVGQTNLPASLEILNAGTVPESDLDTTLTAIRLVPACGTAISNTGDCPAGSADPFVFGLSATGTGESGTACAGQTFTISTTDAATGQVTFTPTTAVVLQLPGAPDDSCTINFTFDVFQGPTKPAGSPPGPNTVVTAQIGFVSGSARQGVDTGSGSGTSFVNVAKAQPGITTAATGTALIGAPIVDTATLSSAGPNVPSPSGTITFNAYFDDATCTTSPAFTSTVTITGAGNYTSTPFTPSAAGTYGWIATYSGDGNNAGATTACSDTGETSMVTKASPVITTTATSAGSGGTISDTAVLAGGDNPTGTLTFNVFGPNFTTCDTDPTDSFTVDIDGNGSYTSPGFDPAALDLGRGTYQWSTHYNGDANNTFANTFCGDPNETSNVTAVTTITTAVGSASVIIGASVTDTADLEGGDNPKGTITFTAYGPNDRDCAATAAFTSTVDVTDGAGMYTSDPFTATVPGTYLFIAAYGGDDNNSPSTTLCGDPNESVVVAAAVPILTTQASGPISTGGTISDTADLTGGVGPTGTIAFTVFGPDDASCDATPLFTSTVMVAGNGTYLSGAFTPTLPGTYQFVDTYSGDASNKGAGPTACPNPAEAVVVSTANPTIVTQASGPVTVGGTITDTATLAGGTNPTGNITFDVFGPNNTTCTGIPPAFVSVVTVSGDNNYTSAPFTVPASGTYEFVASYSGDTQNSPAGPTSCSDPLEGTSGTPASPTITSQASSSTVVGGTINDTAILTGGANPTGNITFDAYGPNNSNCTGTPAFISAVPVNGTGNYTSALFTPAAPGSYQFVASYSGDANNNPVGPTACNVAAETVAVTPVAVSLSTTASPSVDVGQAVLDTAALGGGAGPTGTITFTLYGPNDTACASTPAFISTVPVMGTGDYPSASFITTAPGTYAFVATYSGDATHSAAGPTPCDDPAEAVVVLPTPQIGVTKVAAPLTKPEPGGNFTFTVTVNNPSAVDPVTITSLADNVYGDLSTLAGSTCGSLIGVTLAPGATSPPCSFTGAFMGKGGASQTDTVTVTGMDSHGVKVSATAQATVTLTTVLPSISVTKVANPLSEPEPGGTFTFTVQVTNNNAIDAITITSLVDNIYGNLATLTGSTCGALIGTTLAPGATSAPCSFTGTFTGKGGDSQTDTVTVTGQDSNGNMASATAKATVTLTTVTPVIAVIKAANPLSLPAPGGTFTFTVQVSNPSATDPIKITSLTDNIYGDLSTRAGSNCGTLIGTTLAPGAALAPCTFPGAFTGVSGASQTDTVTVTGTDSNGNTVTATANATVTLTASSVSIKTTASPAVTLGGTITDTATLSGGGGGDGPSGTITFTAYGPNDSTCTAIPAFTSMASVNGDGEYTSAPFSPTAPGTYRFTAAYGGDDANSPAASACGDPNESVAVNPVVPSLTTTAVASGPNGCGSCAAGETISDTATLSGGAGPDGPTGSITFTAFGPNDATCAHAGAFTSTTTVDRGDGSYTSNAFPVTEAGTYDFVAAYSGDADNAPVATLCGDPGESVVVAPAVPALTTTASASVPVGDAIADTATLAGGVNPMGTITFELFGPDDTTCTRTPIFTSTVPVAGNADYPSGAFATTEAGTYHFEASYSGDANNAATTLDTCGASAETVTVTQASPMVATSASAGVAAGGAISDTATLARGFSPTGAITFTVFGPNDATCKATPIFTSTVPIAGNGTYPSAPFTAVAAGGYNFEAAYSGDVDNAAVTTACGDPNESVAVRPAGPTLTTEASAPTPKGGAISDTATLAGGVNPTGTITFEVFGPDTGCDAEPASTSTVTVTGNGAYPSAPFTADIAGTYEWSASYGGDANNSGATTACGDPGETSSVLAVPTIATTASPTTELGGTISDTATLEGGDAPTGTITFQMFGPGDGGCESPVATLTTMVDGDGSYSSPSFTPTATGTYQFVAAYSGDAKNTTATTACGDPNEHVAVTPVTPALSTQASPAVTLGGEISDVATLAGGMAPSGTITFGLFGPGDATCSRAPLFTSIVAVSGDGTYDSGSFAPTAPGAYRFVATYSGDARNAGVVTGCADDLESVVVRPANPAVTTQASPPVVVGGAISDRAILAGGSNPTGTITFRAFGPGDASCAGTAAFTSNRAVTGDGTYGSGGFSPGVPGTYRFTAGYGGDGDNNPTVTACNDPGESVVVAAIPPTTTTTTTSTTSTTVGGTTTVTTVPATTATAPPTTRPTTATTSPHTTPATTTTTTTTTTTSTTTPSTTTPSSTTTPTTAGPPIAALRLDRISTPPDGPALATGRGCVPNSAVTLSIGAMTIGSSVAGADGTFTAQLHLDVPVGRYTVTARCGVTLTATINVVLSSQANPPTSTAAILLILLLLILGLVRSQFVER